MDDEDELTEAERRALSALPDETALPAGLEDRVAEALRRRGLLTATGSRAEPSSRRGLFRLVAAAGLFGTGLGTGLFLSGSDRTSGPVRGPDSGQVPGSSPGSLYLLLLYPGPGFSPGDAAAEAARVAEYGAWAAELRRGGRLVSAEKLGGGARVFEAGEASDVAEGPQGFFLVRSSTLAEAEDIARTCPHLRHGGRVAVHPVDRT